MSYQEIGPIIERWTKQQQLHLMVENSLIKRRYFYISSRTGQTFQVVIEPEKSSQVRIDAHLIESPDNQEAHFVWEVSVFRIKDVLDLVLRCVHTWLSAAR